MKEWTKGREPNLNTLENYNKKKWQGRGEEKLHPGIYNSDMRIFSNKVNQYLLKN